MMEQRELILLLKCKMYQLPDAIKRAWRTAGLPE